MVMPTVSKLAWGRWRMWVAARPPAIAEAATKWPGCTPSGELECYRSKRHRDAHYAIRSYEEGERVTVTVIHGADSFLPGVGAFGQELEELVRCGCGQWREASELEAARSNARVRARRGGG